MPNNGEGEGESNNVGLIRRLGDALGALFMMLLALGSVAVGLWFISRIAIDIFRDQNLIEASTHIMATLGCILACQLLLDKAHDWATTGFFFRQDDVDDTDEEE